jgi:hypothetical protein
MVTDDELEEVRWRASVLHDELERLTVDDGMWALLLPGERVIVQHANAMAERQWEADGLAQWERRVRRVLQPVALRLWLKSLGRW